MATSETFSMPLDNCGNFSTPTLSALFYYISFILSEQLVSVFNSSCHNFLQKDPFRQVKVAKKFIKVCCAPLNLLFYKQRALTKNFVVS